MSYFKNMAVSIHHQNSQKLSVEMFKVSGGLGSEFLVVQEALNFLD